MILRINILSIFFLLASLVYGQQEDSLYIDSSRTLQYQNNFYEIQSRLAEFDLHREFNTFKLNIPIDGDTKTLWLRTKLAIKETETSENNFSPHFLSPLEKQLKENSKLNPLTFVLGAVQAGAAGYLAYKHIKKYGLFK